MSLRSLLRALPPRLRERIYYGWFHGHYAPWRRFYEAAPLALSPDVSMYDLVPGDAISGSIAFTGFYELELTEKFVRHVRPGGLLVDVGANMGYFSLLWAGLCDEARVIAFEAAPRNVELFRRNVARNHFDDRVTLIAKAVGDEAGEAMFEIGPSDQTGWGGLSTDTATERVAVPVTSLDDELPNEQISVLKIDVEGAEALVLRGCERLLREQRVATLFVEENPIRMQEHGVEPGEIQRILRRFGYETRAFPNGWMAQPASAAAALRSAA